MFQILNKTRRTGTVTTDYPDAEAKVAENYRGAPEFEFAQWRDARPAAEACPTGAITVTDVLLSRSVTIDYGRCIFCGECAAASNDGAVRITRKFELAAAERRDLVIAAEYRLNADGSHNRLVRAEPAEEVGPRLKGEIHRLLGRSLAIREVDAGSCNGC